MQHLIINGLTKSVQKFQTTRIAESVSRMIMAHFKPKGFRGKTTDSYSPYRYVQISINEISVYIRHTTESLTP